MVVAEPDGNALSDREHLADSPPARGVEALGHQRIVANEQQPSSPIDDAGYLR
jgi:hypothetical protein